MKTIVNLTSGIAIALLVSVSCDDSRNAVKPASSGSIEPSPTYSAQPITNYTFSGKEGDPLSIDSTKQWLNNYNTLHPKGHAWFFSKQAMQNILSQAGCAGIRFFYAIDDAGNPQILMIGAGSNGRSLAPGNAMSGKTSSRDLSGGADSFTGLEGNPIASADAQRWITNFMNQNPNQIRAHFFGYELLNQILSETGCVGIRANYALNGAGVPQLLLIGTKANGQNILPTSTSGARTEGGGGTVGDASFPCPSYC